MRLYHYTLEKFRAAICKEGLRPSLSNPKHGNGHYFSDLPPQAAMKFSREELYQAMFSSAGKWGEAGSFPKIAFITFELPAERLTRLCDLFSGNVQSAYPTLGLWLHPGEAILSVEYIQDSGEICFPGES